MRPQAQLIRVRPINEFVFFFGFWVSWGELAHIAGFCSRIHW